MKNGDKVKHNIIDKTLLEEMGDYGQFDGVLTIFEISDEPGDDFPYLAGPNEKDAVWFKESELELVQ